MTRHSRLTLMAGTAITILASPASAGQGRDIPVIIVHLDDQVALAEPDRDTVVADVDRIFQAAGVQIEWAGALHRPVGDAPSDGRRRVAIALLDPQAPFGEGDDDRDVLARAAPAYGRGWVFVNRVRDAARGGTVDARVLLARVIAHEIGHLVLPAGSGHAEAGLMRSSLALTTVGLFRFTPDQARQIRAALNERRAQRR